MKTTLLNVVWMLVAFVESILRLAAVVCQIESDFCRSLARSLSNLRPTKENSPQLSEENLSA